MHHGGAIKLYKHKFQIRIFECMLNGLGGKKEGRHHQQSAQNHYQKTRERES